jgi:hypothetical protein
MGPEYPTFPFMKKNLDNSGNGWLDHHGLFFSSPIILNLCRYSIICNLDNGLNLDNSLKYIEFLLLSVLFWKNFTEITSFSITIVYLALKVD